MSRTRKDEPYWVKLNQPHNYSMEYRCSHHRLAGKRRRTFAEWLSQETETKMNYWYTTNDGTFVNRAEYFTIRDLAHAEKLRTGEMPHINVRTITLTHEPQEDENSLPARYWPEECDKDETATGSSDGRMCTRYITIKGKRTSQWYDKPDQWLKKAEEKSRRHKTRQDMKRHARLHNNGNALEEIDLSSTETMTSPSTDWSIW